MKAIIGLFGVLVGAAITGIVAFIIDARQNKRLEKDAIRRRRVDIVVNLLGSRYVLDKTYSASSSEVQVFNTAIALMPVYFGGEKGVMRAFDAFITSSSDDNLLALLQAAANANRMETSLSNLKNLYTVRAGTK